MIFIYLKKAHFIEMKRNKILFSKKFKNVKFD